MVITGSVEYIIKKDNFSLFLHSFQFLYFHPFSQDSFFRFSIDNIIFWYIFFIILLFIHIFLFVGKIGKENEDETVNKKRKIGLYCIVASENRKWENLRALYSKNRRGRSGRGSKRNERK